MEINLKKPAQIDIRGNLVEFDTRDYEQVNILTSKQGTVRGGHYHKKLKETFYLIEGKAMLETVNVKTKELTSFDITPGQIFSIEPYTFHTLKMLTDTIFFIGYTRAFDSRNPDIYIL
jgi:dTDP-4-dehydrorhamnose 3,5-epimerase-like enzyme